MQASRCPCNMMHLIRSIGTDKCESYSFKYKDHTVHLIDTPGFDDTRKSDTDVLRDIAGWLVLAYRHNIRLSGMVYLHSISENRMKGSHRTNLRMFQKLAGLENLGSVILTTTMWDKTPQEVGKDRETELINKDEFWGSMIKNGSEFRRFSNDKASALKIIGRIIDKHKKFVLSLQKEMADGHKALDETDAGKALNLEMNKQKEMFEKKLQEQEVEMQDALKENDLKYAQAVLDAQDKIQKDMERLAENQLRLQVDNEKLLQEKEEQIQTAREEIEKIRINAENEGKAHADELARMREGFLEAEKEMQKGREKLENDTKALRDNLVQQTADIVDLMDRTYVNITNDQEARMREIQAGVSAAHPSPPPPYQPYAQQQYQFPPQPVYQPIYYPSHKQGQSQKEDILTGVATAVGAGAAMLVGAAPLCTIM